MRTRYEPFRALSQLRLFAALLLIAFLGELAVMLVLPLVVPGASELAGSGLDALLLAVLLAPFLWWLVVRPLRATSQREYEALVQSLDGIVWESDAETFAFTFVSRQAERILGYPVERWLREPDFWRDHIHPEDRERAVAYCLGATRERRDHELEYRMLAADGRAVWLHDVVTVVAGEGRQVRLRGVMVDITEGKGTQVALEAAERQFRTLVEQSLAGIYIIQDGRFRYVNQRAAEMLGCSRDEMVSRLGVLDVVVEEDRELVESKIRERIEGSAQSAQYAFRARRGDRTLVHLEVFGTRTELDGRPAIIGTALDVTDRRRTEEALRESEASIRGFVENAVFGIYRSTVDGRLTMVNPALVEMLGYDSAEELLGVDMATGLYRDPAERARLIAQYGPHERFDVVEVEWKRKDGSPIAVRLTGRGLRDAQGTVLGFEVIVEDVSERQALQRQLQQAQKMEAVGQLAGGMAHNFNNLLTAILTTTELMSRELPADSPLRADVEAIREAGIHGAALTSKLLGFSRRKELEFQVLDLSELLGDFTRLLRGLVPENIELKMALEPAGAVVRADADAVEQIVMNLVTNARDAMPGGGTLVISTARAALDQEFSERYGWGGPGDYVVLTVSDTGGGMDRQTQQRIFEPFFSTKPVGVGTGLGMAMVYGLVKQQGGYVHVYSEPGRGTTVKVYFQAESGVAPSRTTQETPVVKGGTERILVVEDELALRRAAERALEKHGYTVLVAADGQEALELLRMEKGAIDLVVTDVVMPRLGGSELVEALRLERVEVPVLLTSGYTAPHPRVAPGLPSGLPFLAKPWTIAELLAAVRSALDKRPRLPNARADRATPSGTTPRAR
ncbi:MAG: PAS domain S-box protein [Gemmatimonadetes bacterium]|nr:PAS domain S-box protein [Gemmatimonadota bacterium]